MFKTFLAAHDMKGAASLERGGKKGILHIQAVVECTVPCTAEGETAFRAYFKPSCGITAGAKMTFKPFAAGQAISHMLGYLQKDEGQQHYRLDVLLLFMCRSDQYCPCSTWCTSAPGRPLDYQVGCAMMMIAYRPMETTLAQVRNLFWGWHLLPAALKWRYFSIMPDFGSTLTQLQAAACKPWYDHMYEGPIMKAVVIELRKYMVTCNIKHDDYNVVDGIF
ncbi:hypothetical protein COO60DRAFT_1546961, partial [Scenedesmus sp. NREL 46B-D3]